MSGGEAAEAALPAAIDAEARQRLRRFVALLERWQATHNLIGRSTLRDVWQRHVADSAQLNDHAGAFEHWVDIGSGAGFPGLVVAILHADDRDKRFTLVEANAKKAAFLRAAARETGANVRVVADRIEAFARREPASADIVSARALAPLSAILALAVPLMRTNGRLILLKGQDFVHEADEASQSWSYDLIVSPSVVDSSGCVAVVQNPEAKR